MVEVSRVKFGLGGLKISEFKIQGVRFVYLDLGNTWVNGLVSLAWGFLLRAAGPILNASTRNLWAHGSMLKVPLTAEVGALTHSGMQGLALDLLTEGMQLSGWCIRSFQWI